MRGWLLPFDQQLLTSDRFDPDLALLADRHYSRGKVGSPQFSPPGELIVLRDAGARCVFTWVRQIYRKDGLAGTFHNSLFRNESPRLSSDVILEAERYAVRKWGEGIATSYVDPAKIRSTNPGYCFQMAGWEKVTAVIRNDGKILYQKWLEGR